MHKISSSISKYILICRLIMLAAESSGPISPTSPMSIWIQKFVLNVSLFLRDQFQRFLFGLWLNWKASNIDTEYYTHLASTVAIFLSVIEDQSKCDGDGILKSSACGLWRSYMDLSHLACLLVVRLFPLTKNKRKFARKRHLDSTNITNIQLQLKLIYFEKKVRTYQRFELSH